jgi:hypothetical protein
VRSLVVHDPLAEFLGATADGRIEYRYVDAVKLAGHSCPTVAAAYWMTLKALAAPLPRCAAAARRHPRRLPRGPPVGRDRRHRQCRLLLTGATHDTGFKGIAGRFDRRKLLYFSPGSPRKSASRESTPARRSRSRRAATRSLRARDPRTDAEMPGRQRHTGRSREFRDNWQARVRSLLLEHGDDPEVFVLRRPGAGRFQRMRERRASMQSMSCLLTLRSRWLSSISSSIISLTPMRGSSAMMRDRLSRSSTATVTGIQRDAAGEARLAIDQRHFAQGLARTGGAHDLRQAAHVLLDDLDAAFQQQQHEVAVSPSRMISVPSGAR